MTRRAKSTVCLFLTAFIWGVAFVAQRVGADLIGSFTFTGVRFAMGAAVLVPVFLLLERDTGDAARRKRTLLSGLGGGVILFIASNLQQFGVALTGSAGKAGFITGLYIVLVPILGVFMRKTPAWPTWVGAVLACGGMYFLSASEGLFSIGIGDIVLLIGALFWAVHIILVDRFALDVNAIRFSCTQFFTCSVLSLISAFLFEEVTMSGLMEARWPLLYAGLLSVGIAYTLQIFGQRGVEPGRAAIIFSLESVFSAIGAALLIGEFLTLQGYIGCLCILAGILASQITVGKQKRECGQAV